MLGVVCRVLARNLPLMAAASLFCTGTAHAHFKLLKPGSWVNEDSSGGPQKGGPCGPGGADDVQPVPMSMNVTTVHAGETIMVEFEETVHHPGWFRIALAEDRSTFKDPTFPNPTDCRVDMKTVPTTPHDNVLVDGLGMDTNIAGSNRKFMEAVKIPDKPCDKCTLQVIQVMADQLHAPPGCIYYHCADLKILPAGAAAAGSGASGSAGAATAAGGAGAKAEAGASAAGSSSTAGTSAAAGAAVAGASGTSASQATTTTSSAGAAGSITTTTTAAPSSSTTSAGTVASTTGATSATATPSAPAAPSSSSCAVLTPGREPGAAALLWLFAASLIVARARRRASR